MSTAAVVRDLTATKAPFIEVARRRGNLFIAQPYEEYSEENQEAWRRLYTGLCPLWERYANERFIDGLKRLSLRADTIPRLSAVNTFLRPLTGFQAKAVSGYVPAYLFFDCLRRREFPTTITIRSLDQLDYLPEPDIFYDIAGHVPMHTDPIFADVLARFGEVAHSAVASVRELRNGAERLQRLDSVVTAMARFFWFTIEFGLMHGRFGDVRVYGSGLLSSYDEIQHSVESPHVQRYPFQIEWVVNQSFEIDHFQPLLFVIDSFDHLYSEVEKLEHWIRAGRLDHVSPGEPRTSELDLQSFLDAGPELRAC